MGIKRSRVAHNETVYKTFHEQNDTNNTNNTSRQVQPGPPKMKLFAATLAVLASAVLASPVAPRQDLVPYTLKISS